MLFILMLFLPLSIANAFDNSHKIAYEIGGYNGKFFFPVSELEYQSPFLFDQNIGFRVRLRATDTPCFFSASFVHFYAIGEWGFSQPTEWLTLYAGIGAVAWLDFTYNQFSSVQPLLSFRLTVSLNGFFTELPLLFRFYSDGFALENRLLIGYYFTDWFGAFIELDGTILSTYRFDNAAFYPQCLLGLRFSI